MTVREQKKINDKPLPECPECLQPTDQGELDMFGGVCENCRYIDDDLHRNVLDDGIDCGAEKYGF